MSRQEAYGPLAQTATNDKYAHHILVPLATAPPTDSKQ